MSREEMLAENRARAARNRVTRRGETSTNTEDKKTKTKKENKTLRYPYKMLDGNTDYLRIQIAEYKAPGLKFSDGKGIDELVTFDKGKSEVRNDKGEITQKEVKPSFKNQAGSFQLNTGSEANRNSLKNPLHTIILPIPRQLTDTSEVSWNGSTLNPIEAFGVAAAGAVMSSDSSESAIAAGGAAVEAAFTKAGGMFGDAQFKQAVIAALSGRAIGALGGNVSGNQLVSRATGQVFNPNLELLFEGVNLRNFPFSFEFFPRNQREATEVMKIIRVLKQSMLPRKNSTTATSGVFLGAPMVFQLTYMQGKGPHPFLNRFLPMALANINLSYTGSGTYSTFPDGTPTHIKMDLAFKELNPIYSEDYTKEIGGVGY
jgi:hypothetical protein